MKKRKMMALAICATMAIGLLAGCGGTKNNAGDNGNSAKAEQNTSSGDTVQLSICHIASENDPIHEGWTYFKDQLEEKSNGRFQVTIYGNKSIASSDTEAAEKVQQNIVQVTSTPSYAPAALGGVDGYKVFDYPYLFETNDDIYKFVETDLYQEWAQQLEDATGVRPLGAYSIGWLAIGTTKKDLNTIGDIKGQKIRTMSTDVQMDIINALAGSATPVNYGELYTACQQGTVDGLMTSTGLIVSDRFYEVCKHFICPEASANVHIPLVNAQWYDGLDDDMKAVFDECFEDYLNYERDLQDQFNENALQTIEDAGCTVTELSAEEKEEWKSVLNKVYEDYPDAAGPGVAAQVKEIMSK